VTETEWLSSSDPQKMLAFLRDRGASARKLRLFAVACSRRAWPRIDDLGRAAVELAERFADGRAGAEQLRAARLACKGSGGQSSWYAAVTDPAIAARNAALSALDGAACPDRERPAQADLLRDIFGNPVRPVSLDPSWRTETAVALATRMYESRDFSLMPIMGDALVDAGCEEESILNHCRWSGPHVRGCFVVDLVLGGS
jgi:hypothetical protein